MSCSKARAALGENNAAIAEQVDARKTRVDADAAWTMISSAQVVHVAKGKKTQAFNPATDDRAAILKAVMGPSGNLRAPTLRVGSTLLVGFNEDSYRNVLG